MMKKIILCTFLFLAAMNAEAQIEKKINVKNLQNVWGQISKNCPTHRGKFGLIILSLDKDMTFKAFENTDYGATILQSGTWKIKGSFIVFDVQKTELGRKEKEYFLKGKIIERDEGIVKYKIVKLDDTNLIISDLKTKKTLKFKVTTLRYGIN